MSLWGDDSVAKKGADRLGTKRLNAFVDSTCCVNNKGLSRHQCLKLGKTEIQCSYLPLNLH